MYEILSEDKILLKFPDDILNNKNAVEKIENLFFNNIALELDLQRDFINFENIGRLYSHKFTLDFNSTIFSPENREYFLDESLVIKTSGILVVKETLKTRVRPSISAPVLSMRLADRFVQFENLFINPYDSISVVFPGETFNFIAITKNKDIIDGHNKPWYKVVIENEGANEYAWIYGGYIEETTEKKFEHEMLLEYLVKNNYINSAQIINER